jgi:hypothetical protein
MARAPGRDLLLCLAARRPAGRSHSGQPQMPKRMTAAGTIRPPARLGLAAAPAGATPKNLLPAAVVAAASTEGRHAAASRLPPTPSSPASRARAGIPVAI